MTVLRGLLPLFLVGVGPFLRVADLSLSNDASLLPAADVPFVAIAPSLVVAVLSPVNAAFRSPAQLAVALDVWQMLRMISFVKFT